MTSVGEATRRRASSGVRARAQSGDQFQTQELYGPSDPETGVKAAVSQPEGGPHKGCNGHAVPARADSRAASGAGAARARGAWLRLGARSGRARASVPWRPDRPAHLARPWALPVDQRPVLRAAGLSAGVKYLGGLREHLREPSARARAPGRRSALEVVVRDPEDPAPSGGCCGGGCGGGRPQQGPPAWYQARPPCRCELSRQHLSGAGRGGRCLRRVCVACVGSRLSCCSAWARSPAVLAQAVPGAGGDLSRSG